MLEINFTSNLSLYRISSATIIENIGNCVAQNGILSKWKGVKNMYRINKLKRTVGIFLNLLLSTNVVETNTMK